MAISGSALCGEPSVVPAGTTWRDDALVADYPGAERGYGVDRLAGDEALDSGALRWQS